MKRGVMISQIEPESRKVEKKTFQVIEEVTKDNFFHALQTVEIPFSRERKEVAALIKDRSLELTYCLARILNESGGNLSSLDPSVRKGSVGTILEQLDSALETGAKRIVLISGKAPEEKGNRIDALEALYSSLIEIAEKMDKRKVFLPIVLEPLDTEAHKNQTLGYVNEGIDLVTKLNSDIGAEQFSLCLDTAHMLLNGENIYDFSKIHLEGVSEFHFCNPVLDKENKFYGDNHIPFGKPGVLTGEEAAKVYQALQKGGIQDDVGVFFEIKRPEDWNLHDIVSHTKELFGNL